MPVERGRDMQGYFYRYGRSGKKYRYRPGDAASRKKAKRLAFVQGLAIQYSQRRGGALTLNPIENLRRIGRFIVGRTPHSPDLVNLLAKHGSERIQTINVARQPIQGGIRKALNVLTLGGINRIPYDTLWHLFAVIRTESGTVFTVEKNEVLRISLGAGSVRPEQGGTATTAYSGFGKRPSLNEFFSRGIQVVGAKRFFTYDPFSWNCQDFIANCLLQPNGMLTSSLRSFILQDTKEILKHLPSYAGSAARILTDLAARFRLLVGQGARTSNRSYYRPRI
jgi:hypothetical protein